MNLFASDVLGMGSSQDPYLVSEGFQIWLIIRRNIRNFDWISAVVYSGVLLLPILFNTESWDSSHCL